MEDPAPRFPLIGLLTLAGAIFVSVTGEFLPTGLLPDMARDLEVSVGQTGLLVTVFAATVVVAAAPLAFLTRTVSRKGLVFGVLLVNALATVLAAAAPNYEVLVGARVLGGLAHGLFWAVVGSYAAHLVPKAQLARAIAITGAGGSAAFVLGVPVGTLLGHGAGWRPAFLMIAAAMVVLAVLVLAYLPAVDHSVPVTTGEIPLPARRDPTLPGVLAVCLVIVVLIVGQNIFYTYIAPYLTGTAGFDPGAVGPILFLYGGAGAVGLLIAGIVGSRYPTGAMLVSIGVAIVCVLVLAAAPRAPGVVVVAVVAWGASFGVVPPLLQTRNMSLASIRIRDQASAWMTTAFNIGIGGGALVGAALLPLGGVEVLPWVGAAVMGVALVLVALIAGKSRRKGSAGSVIV
ncbi:MFS transporter [Naasia aerilata]|uniref:MFS transporter n=1 Tax=Naasia aerilata TaxID=1162966 RepID=A0ABM8G9Q7_9MICO|nr:MFS transporter [Naasia aerilata]BDZ44931.1 MFS transporter [Naasia aerilata]